MGALRLVDCPCFELVLLSFYHVLGFIPTRDYTILFLHFSILLLLSLLLLLHNSREVAGTHLNLVKSPVPGHVFLLYQIEFGSALFFFLHWKSGLALVQ